MFHKGISNSDTEIRTFSEHRKVFFKASQFLGNDYTRLFVKQIYNIKWRIRPNSCLGILVLQYRMYNDNISWFQNVYFTVVTVRN